MQARDRLDLLAGPNWARFVSTRRAAGMWRLGLAPARQGGLFAVMYSWFTESMTLYLYPVQYSGETGPSGRPDRHLAESFSGDTYADLLTNAKADGIFTCDLDLDEYLKTIRHGCSLSGITITVDGPTVEDRCRSVIDQLVAAGLATVSQDPVH